MDRFSRQNCWVRGFGFNTPVSLLVFGLLMATLPVLSQPAFADAPSCQGLPATIYVQNGVIVGGPDDGQAYTGTLNGTSGDDVIVGTTGNDVINNNGGADTICGGDGNDTINIGVAGSLDTTVGTIVDGGNGTDLINLTDQSSMESHSYEVFDSAVKRDAVSTIAYLNAERLVLNSGNSSDTVEVRSTKSTTPVVLNVAGGDDAISVGSADDASSTINDILGAVTVNGGDGNDVVRCNDQGATGSQTYAITGTSLARTSAATITFVKLEQLNLATGGGVNTINMQQTIAAMPVTVTGNSNGTNTLVGPNLTNTWTLDGTKSGTLVPSSGAPVTFTNMNNLTGGVGADTFIFSPTGSGFATINGGAGTDTLDLSAFPDNMTLNITAGNSGNTGGHTSTANFAAMETYKTGIGNDKFTFAAGVGVSGSINAGSGSNTLDYHNYATAVSVNLATGAATGVGGRIYSTAGSLANGTTQFSSIQSVIGGSGNDVLTGDSQDNVLVGNAGKDVLNGGGGYDILIGGDGSDSLTAANTTATATLMIGGRTTYDNDIAGLLALVAEWGRTDEATAQKQAHLTGTTGGANGTSFLFSFDASRNVFAQASVVDTFTDNAVTNAEADWVWYNIGKDSITGLKRSGDLFTLENM